MLAVTSCESGATLAWQYKGHAPIDFTGSFRVLDGGGGIVGWGTMPGYVFTEVDAVGHDLVDFFFTDGSVSYRAIKVPLSQLDIGLLRQNTAK